MLPIDRRPLCGRHLPREAEFVAHCPDTTIVVRWDVSPNSMAPVDPIDGVAPPSPVTPLVTPDAARPCQVSENVDLHYVSLSQ